MVSRIFIVIAAYNEEKSIANVIAELTKEGYRDIVVVDDGSADGTFSAASKAGVFALKHIINRGQGAALKTGMDFAVSKGADVIVTFDADGQHQASDIKMLIKPVINGAVDVTLGSRFLKSSKTNAPFIKILYLKIGVLVLRLMYGIRVTDAHNGIRAFSRKAVEAIDIRSDRMEHASEIIDQIGKKHLRYMEIPVEIKYTEYAIKHGQNYITNAFNIFFKMVFKKLMG
jgi:glycosyltransferase involved in cell wall biosynthesis